MPRPSYRSTLARFYLFTFCYDLVFAYPIYAILFQMRGLDLLQISMLLMWWALCAAIFEVPSGALADHWSRRNLLVLAPLIKMMCYVVWYFAGGSFFLFALGFTFWGLGSSFQSGTVEAMLYDTLVFFRKPDQYERVRGRQRVFFHFACGAAAITGGMIAYYSPNVALLLSVIPLMVGAGVALAMTEPPRVHLVGDAHYFTHFRNAWTEFKVNGVFRYVLVYMVMTVGMLAQMDECDPLYYTFVGVPLFAVGWLLMARGVLESAGGLMAHRLKHLAFIETFVPVVIGVLLVIVGFFPCKAAIALILMSYLILAPVEVIIEGRLQSSMRTASRATVLSGISLFETLASLPVMALFGLVAKRWGLGAGYVFFGIIILCFGGYVICSKSRKSASASLKGRVRK